MSSLPVAALLFSSGVTALVFETLWVKQVALLVGIDVVAVTTVVSGFFAGLGLGGAILGQRADATRRPLALYAGLEAGVAVGGAVVTIALARLAPLQAAVARVVGEGAWALPFLLVAAPAFLMGGTLPAAVRSAAPSAPGVAGSAGRLYAANTAGGVVGALVAVLVLVPALGVRGTGLTAASLAGLTALAAIALARPVNTPAAAPLDADAGRVARALYAGAGAVALGYEVAWTQIAVPLLGTRAVAFAVVLAVYLTGLVVGSAAWARFAGRVRRPWVAFALIELGVAGSALAAFAALGPWMPATQAAASTAVRAWTGSASAALGVHMMVAAGALLLVPAVFLGAAFPAAARLACGPAHVGADVGAIAAANTLGGIVGTCLAGFAAIPLLGLRGTVVALSVASTALGTVALARGGGGRGVVVGAVALVGCAVVGWRLPRDHLARALFADRPGTVVSYEESFGGAVTVVEEPFFDTSFRRLFIQGVSNSNDGLMSRRYMRLQTLLPLLVHDGDSRSALVIGLGTGITCGALLRFPELERRACVELLPAVVRASRLFDGNYAVADDRRVELRLGDGRHDLLVHDARYDLITLEPPPPTAAGVVNLYSRDFYTLARDRLAPHGLLAQWLPLGTQSDDETRMLVRSFLDVFPDVTLWSTELHETLLVGGAEPLALDGERIRARLAVPEVAESLREVGISDVEGLLATYLTDRDGLESYAGDAPPVTDDRPRIEHASLTGAGAFFPALAHLLRSRRDPPVRDPDDGLLARVAERRQRLVDFYQAAVYWYAGQTEQVEPLLRRVLEAEPDNRYFAWFVGR